MAAPRAFWIAYGASWAVFAGMAVGGVALLADGQPDGILEHQSAGSAARAASIHASWAQFGRTELAQALMAMDFVFIGLSFLACVIGGLWLWRAGGRTLGAAVLLGGLIAYGTDLTETTAQALQLFSVGPDEGLARLAKAMVAPKLWAYGIAQVGLLIGVARFRPKG